jgi:membrane associated rhomboid family serine protease/Tfp pilus assembly protein PilF
MRIDPPLNQAARFPVTAALALASIGVSLAWWGGVNIDPILLGTGTAVSRPWGLVLDIFPHVNIVHLLFNLMWMWTLGARVEHVFGRGRYVAILLLIAIVSSAAQYAVSSGGVGLSGVVYGVFGLMYAMRARHPVFAQVTGPQTVQLLAAWFVVCIVLTLADVMRVGNVAHGSGAVIGWLIGRACAETRERRVRWTAIAAAATVVSLAGATVARPWLGGAAGDADMHARAGYEAMTRQDYAAAARELELAAKSPTVRPQTLANLGMCYQHLGRDSEALPFYRRAAAMDPRLMPELSEAMASILNMQGHDAAKEGMFNEAVTAFTEAAKLRPRDEYAWRMLGVVHEQQGDLGTAHQSYRRAQQISPSDKELAAAVERTAPKPKSEPESDPGKP